MAAEIEDKKKSQFSEEETAELDELFKSAYLAEEPDKMAIRTATEELVILAKKRRITLDEVGSSTGQILGKLYFRDVASKMKIINYIHRVWGRTHNGKKAKS